MEKRLVEKASEEDHATCRFFLTPKDVSNLAWRLAIGKVVSTHDSTNLHTTMSKWLETSKIIFFQMYEFTLLPPFRRKGLSYL